MYCDLELKGQFNVVVMGSRSAMLCFSKVQSYKVNIIKVLVIKYKKFNNSVLPQINFQLFLYCEKYTIIKSTVLRIIENLFIC